MNLLHCQQFTETQKYLYVSLLYEAYFAINKIFVYLGTANKNVSLNLAAFLPFRGPGLPFRGTEFC